MSILRQDDLMEDSKIEPGEIVSAVFNPTRTEDLCQGAAKMVGKSGQFEALWIIEEGIYAGQIAYLIPKNWKISAIWIPSEDLSPI